MIFRLCAASIISLGINFGLYATNPSDKFPFISHLPKGSIIRQKCLESPYHKSSNDNWLSKEKTLRACKALEKQVKSYAAEEHGWHYEKNSDSAKYYDSNRLTRDQKLVLCRLYDNLYDSLATIIYGRDCRLGIYEGEFGRLLVLFQIARHEREAKYAGDETTRQQHLEKVAELEATFVAADNQENPNK